MTQQTQQTYSHQLVTDLLQICYGESTRKLV